MNKVYILNVGTSLNLKKPEENWLHKNRISEVECDTTYNFIKKENGSIIIASTAGGIAQVGTKVEMIADQTGRNMGYGEIVLSINAKDFVKSNEQIKALTNKNGFSYYVYK
jgi:hypothetical protein